MLSLVAFTLVAGLLPGPRLVGPADVYRSAVSDLRNERLSVPRMGYEEITFIIHPDGRIEERVRGVKGKNCQELTNEINEMLGEVYHTEATEEMFEQEVVVEQEVENLNQLGSNSGPSSWGVGGKQSEGGGAAPLSEW